MEEASMYKDPKIKLWRFPLQNNRSRFEDGGRNYFEVRSTERASELGVRVEAVKRIRLQRLRNNAWVLNGIVVLADQKAIADPSSAERQVDIGVATVVS
jgi:hypothetical protein